MRSCYKKTAVGELGGALSVGLLVSMLFGGPRGVWKNQSPRPFIAIATSMFCGGEAGRIYGTTSCMQNLLSLEPKGSHLAFATRQLMLSSPKSSDFIPRYDLSPSKTPLFSEQCK